MSNLPDSTKEVFEAVKEEVTWLYTTWEIYKQLFRSSDKRRYLLQECAYVFFTKISDVLKDDLHLSLSKLTDPARTGSFDNLSLWQLQEEIEKNGDEEFCSRLCSILDKIEKKSKVVRDHRNKRIAHRDLDTARQRNANLEPVSVEMVEEVMSLMRDYMNAIEGKTHLYEGGIDLYQGVEALVGVLEHGLHFRRLWQDGKIPSDEWCKGEWSDA